MADSEFKTEPGRGSMFENANKSEESKHDHFGSFVADRDIKVGEEVKFNAYNNVSKGGKSYIGIQLKNPNYKSNKPPF